MAVRTNAAEVKLLLENTKLSDPDIEDFISIANLIVNEDIGDSILSDDRLKEIERYLTAHLITTGPERMATAEDIGDVSVKYLGKSGEGLNASPHGQMAKRLDTTGKLANLGKKRAYVRSIKTNYD